MRWTRPLRWAGAPGAGPCWTPVEIAGACAIAGLNETADPRIRAADKISAEQRARETCIRSVSREQSERGLREKSAQELEHAESLQIIPGGEQQQSEHQSKA